MTGAIIGECVSGLMRDRNLYRSYDLQSGIGGLFRSNKPSSRLDESLEGGVGIADF
jgi:hypothetical protein